MVDAVLCVDFGSTFTKAALVDAESGTLLGTASHRTTIDTDVLDGYDACLGALRADHPEVDGAKVLACSSAGGGLRVAVVGNEELVTAEAGRRVALSSGGKVVHVVALAADADPLPGLLASRPDVVLLVGGTDGGNTEALLAGARMLAGARWATPVVVAGNVDAREDVAAAPGQVGHAVRARRQRRPQDRRARARLRTGRDPRDVPGPRDRWQAPELPRGLRRDGARPHARPGAHRGRGARRDPGTGRGRGRRRRRHHRRPLRRRPRPGGRHAGTRGGRDDACDAHRRGRPGHALERGHHRRVRGGGRAAQGRQGAGPRRPG